MLTTPLKLCLRTLLCTCVSALFLFSTGLSAQEAVSDRNFIRIDQFGYMPLSTKVAIVAYADRGYNAEKGLRPNPGVPVEVIDGSSGAVVFSAYPKLWNGGSVDAMSGDRGAWFDFTPLQTPGDYRIRVTQLDGSVVESYDFRIADDVYHDVLRAALNFFYYQRINQDKPAQYASGEPWTDGPWFDRPNQEVAVRALDNAGPNRDLSGGWFDAGDPNKYVTFAVDPVHALLTTYDNDPAFWDDFELNIPESGDDNPDLLDEIKFEVDWIKRMQPCDAADNSCGIIQKMGILNDVLYISPPSTDTRLRWYNQVCVSSTITGAGMMAHAALTYDRAGVWPEEVAELTERAEKAWNFYEAAPNKSERCDDGRIEAGDADGPGDQYATEHLALATAAAVYLFELTGDTKYRDFVAANFQQARPWVAGDWGVYRAHQGEALLNYTRNPDADAATVEAILAMKSSGPKSEGPNYLLSERDNLYRARPFYFNWGSNSLISRHAADIMDLQLYDIKPQNHAAYGERAQSIINYLHGTNPSGTCYLSNMYQYGGDLCADEMWHSWFALGTRFDNLDGNNVGPAPGFISGGPNPQGDPSMPIKLGTHVFAGQTAGQQPDQKAFSVDNDWRHGPWAYNEPAIYYQAAYVKALSYFVTDNTTVGQTGNGIAARNGCAEAEDDFTVAAGSAVSRTDVAGAANAGTVELASAGDAATLTFDLTNGGRYDVAVRVRTGAAGGAGTELAESYTLTLNDAETEYVVDATTVANLTGDSHWGEIVIVNALLAPGEQRLTVTANAGSLAIDQLCWRDAFSVGEPDDGGGGGGETGELTCQEAEDGFTALADVGTNSSIRVDNFTPGASEGQYINLFDQGDEASLLVTMEEEGLVNLRFRLRVGEAAGTDRNLADKYIITLDGTVITTELDESTISALEDDTYWGEIVATDVTLAAGEHTVAIKADRDWLKFDRLCLEDLTTGVFDRPRAETARLVAQPNPNGGRFQLTVTVPRPLGGVRASLYDVNGRRVAEQPIGTLTDGENTLTLDYRARGLKPGVYLLRLHGTQGRQFGGLLRVVIR